LSRKASSASGVASCPKIILAGSPGVRWINEKTMILTKKRITTIRPNLRIKNFTMPALPFLRIVFIKNEKPSAWRHGLQAEIKQIAI
jgi:hypothetical protein